MTINIVVVPIGPEFFGSEDEFQTVMEWIVGRYSDVATSGVGVQGQGGRGGGWLRVGSREIRHR